MPTNNNGIVQLPSGTFYFNVPGQSVLAFDERSAGVTIRGAGRDKTLLIPAGNTIAVAIASTLIPYTSAGHFDPIVPTDVVDQITDIGNYAVGDLMYFWKFNESAERSPRQLLTVVEVNTAQQSVRVSGVIGTDLPEKPTNFKHIKGARVVGAVTPGTRTFGLLNAADLAMFAPGDDVVIGDGPGAAQFFGEWATVAAIDGEFGAIVTLAAGVRRSYADGLTCLVPGRPTAPARRGGTWRT